ncbi:MAG TPA: D-2-hydroxyacid dehydrogenase [Bryobacteraceae bacterium]|nr:D-2-hydroxyacid dehydrogenase [Bryobacteraceae bacterium]
MSSDTASPLRVVTMFRFEPHEIERMREVSSRPLEITICESRAAFLEALPAAEVIYGELSGEDLARAPRLRWVQLGSAGVDGVDRRLRESPVLLTNFAGTFAPGIAETAFGLLLSLTRGLRRYYIPQVLRHEWKPVGSPKSADHVEIAGRTMGIVGMGGIGRAIARTACHGFEMRVVATDARFSERPDFVAELHPPSWFPEMVPQVDVLVAAAPLTPETERMFNESVFRAMKSEAYFLALSRGMLYDDMALARALQEGWIAGAGLDVFPQEPPPPDHPLFECPNVVMSMHTSGWGPARQRRLVELFADNLRRYAAGEPLRNVVDKQLGF